MKTIILGDTHARDTWKQIIELENDFDRVVFLGDYFDSYDLSGVIQLHNFLEIVEFKKTSDKEVVLLFGNHDYHYMRGFNGQYHYSGYQPAFAWQFGEAIHENMEHLQMCYLFDNILCTHAGVSSVWLEKHFPNTQITNLESVSMMVDTINDHFKFKPNVFEFDGWDPYGDNVTQSPIWIRPKSLMQSNKDTNLKKQVVQVVGHTQQTNIFESFKSSKKTMGNKYFMIDCIETKGYMVVEDGIMIAKQL